MGLAQTKPQVSTGVTVPAFGEAEQNRVAALGEQYDRERPRQSFADWMAAKGEGALFQAFDVHLIETGQTELRKLVHERPPAPAVPVPTAMSDREVWAEWGPPAEPGPWALNAAGNWFKVTTQAPGAKVDGNIYVPPLSPQVRQTIPELRKPIPAAVRFTDPKFIAANRAALKGDFRALFFRIAPRGCGPEGLGAGLAFQGEPDDYVCEGGDVYPALAPGDPKALELAHWWGTRHAWDATYGTANQLSLNWLRVFTGADGYQHYKPWSSGESSEYFNRWGLAKDGYACGGDEVLDLARRTMAEQARRQAAQPERDLTVHWVWHIGPLSQCAPTSSSRRRKAIKKAAAIGALVAGAVFLGPKIAALVKKAGLGKKIGAAIKVATGRGGGADDGAGDDEQPSNVDTQKALEAVLGVVNAKRTIDAIEDGSVPPPPIDVSGDSFREWAVSIGQQYLEQEMHGQQLDALEQQRAAEEMRYQIESIQRRTQQAAGASPQVIYATPDPRLAAPVQQVQAREADKAPTSPIVYAGAALLALLALRGGL